MTAPSCAGSMPHGVQSRAGGGDAHVGGRQTRVQAAAFADTGTAGDPFVAGVQGAGELLIGDDRRWQVHPCSGDGERHGQAGTGLVEQGPVQGDGHSAELPRARSGHLEEFPYSVLDIGLRMSGAARSVEPQRRRSISRDKDLKFAP